MSLSPLSSMTTLQSLNIDRNYVSDLSPISGRLTTLHAEYNYLDPTAGSDDRAILDAITDAHYDNQNQITVLYNAGSDGVAARPSDTVYYGRSVTPPDVTPNDASWFFVGWDTDLDGVADIAPGASKAVSPPVPVASNTVTYMAVYQKPDDDPVAVDHAINPHLYDDLINFSGAEALDPDGDGKIHASAMRTIGSAGRDTLLLEPYAVDNISGMEYCTNPGLHIIVFEYCFDLTDISPLKNLANLTELYLDNSGVTSFPVLSGMAGLTRLSLMSCASLDNADMAALLTLPKIKDPGDSFELDINATNITDMSIFTSSAAPGLRILNWSAMPDTFSAANVQTLSGCTQLTRLYLDVDTGIGNAALPYINELTNLTFLSMANCGISDLSGISGLRLTNLNAPSNAIASLSPLASMDSLQTLFLDHNFISDLSPVSGFHLTYLHVDYNYIDPTSGSDDRAVLDSFGPSTLVSYGHQYQITVHYDAGSHGTAARSSDTLYYGRGVNLPAVTANDGYVFAGWDTDGDGIADKVAGDYVQIAPPVPVPGNSVTLTAVYTEDPVAVDRSDNPVLYDALLGIYGWRTMDPDEDWLIRASAMRSITGTLDLHTLNISDISGLRYCTNISAISLLNDNHITVLPDMSGMSNLVSLSLWGCTGLDNADMASILDLPKIKDPSANFKLNINQTHITNVSMFTSSAAPGLKILDWETISGSLTAVNIQTLSGLTQLTSLSIAGNPSAGNTALPYIDNLTNLTCLKIDGCSVTDLSGIGDLHLTILWASSNPLTSLSALSTMTTLRTLMVAYCDLADLSPVSGIGLTTLYVNYNYLDSTAGSDDRAVLDSISDVHYDNQYQITVHYDAGSNGTAARASETLYYGRSVALPSVTPNTGFDFDGWDANGDGTADYAAGDSLAITPPVPVPGNSVTMTAVYHDITHSADLSTLETSEALTPSFSPDITDYQISLAVSFVGSVTITPTAVAGASFTIDSEHILTKSYTLSMGGTVTCTIVVTRNAASLWGFVPVTKTYTITIHRDAPNGPYLLDPGYSTGKLDKPFDPYTTSGYLLTIGEDQPSVTFKPVPSDPTATIKITPAQPMTLTNGQTKTATIKVTVPSTHKSMTYTIKVKRAESTNDSIKNLTVSNCTSALAFDPASQKYYLEVKDNKSSCAITVAKGDNNETVYINGKKATKQTVTIKNSASAMITVKIVAQAGGAYTSYYYIYLDRPAYIKSFTGSPKVGGLPTVVVNGASKKPLKFTWSLAANGGTQASIDIYSDLNGKTLGSAMTGAKTKTGTNTFSWDGKIAGAPLASGTYYAVLTVTYTSPLTGKTYLAVKVLKIVVK